MRPIATKRAAALGGIWIVFFGLVLAGCGGGQEDFTFYVRDDEDRGVEGVAIHLAGQTATLATTDKDGAATVRVSKPSDKNLSFIFSQAEGAPVAYRFEGVYEVTPEMFEDGTLFVRVQAADAKASLDVSSIPPGATVLIDGTPQGTTPTVVQNLEPGSHEIVLKLDGYDPYSLQTYLLAGQNNLQDRALTRTGQAEAALRVSSTPGGAEVIVDGRPTGQKTPTRLSGLDPGRHTIRIELAGYVPYENALEVRPGGPMGTVSAKLARVGGEPEPTPRREPTTQPPARQAFKKEYSITVLPGAAEVYLDGGTKDLFYKGPFKATLTQGVHRFHVRNPAVPVDIELTYEVEPGDRNRILMLNWEEGRVTGR